MANEPCCMVLGQEEVQSGKPAGTCPECHVFGVMLERETHHVPAQEAGGGIASAGRSLLLGWGLGPALVRGFGFVFDGGVSGPRSSSHLRASSNRKDSLTRTRTFPVAWTEAA
ncbi:hypothetical protein C7453_102410 [Gluconacetobacter liquefaciens]|uniref:Uncharacterized protein n=1 Tax=Gluconacetobacter liquefaciens TaxID=89584 RepID=A0A370G8Z6_GLULI|nr:hypothetical protein C7453_102410 [Gluconacetobacter liquefaciens]